MNTLRILRNSLAALLAFQLTPKAAGLQLTPKAAKRVICILSLFTSQKAIAFDPFSIATGAQAVSGILGGLEKVDEFADAGFAVSDLLTELEIDPETDQEIESQVKRLEELDRKARELRSTGRDIKSLTSHDFQNNLLRSKNFATRIKRVRDMIRTTKRLAVIMGLRPRASEKALKIQDARLQYMILDELMAIRRMQFESSLENKEQRAKYQLALGQVLEEEGVTNRRELNVRSFNHGSLR